MLRTADIATSFPDPCSSPQPQHSLHRPFEYADSQTQPTQHYSQSFYPASNASTLDDGDPNSDQEKPYAFLMMRTGRDQVHAQVLKLYSRQVFSAGRGRSCDLVLSGRRISGNHFSISDNVNADGSPVVVIEDHSTNGTFVNLVRIGKGNKRILHSGDEILVGVGVAEEEIRLIVHIESNARQRTTSEPALGQLDEKYEQRDIIGKGAFAVVRFGLDRQTGHSVAIKSIDKARIAMTLGAQNPKDDPQKAASFFRREIDILKRIDHPGIVKYLDMYDSPQSLSLVLEFIDGGDLMDYLLAQPKNCLPEDQACTVTAQILDTLAYLHSRGITHRDLKPENIMVTKTGLVKLTDFGLAKVASVGGIHLGVQETMLRTFCGTLGYLAPEVFTTRESNKNAVEQKSYDSSVDLWSLGCVVFTMLTGSTPFASGSTEETIQLIRSGQYPRHRLQEHDPPRLPSSPQAVEFIDGLLQVDPSNRMSLTAALAHEWVDVQIQSQQSQYSVSEGYSRQPDDNDSQPVQRYFDEDSSQDSSRSSVSLDSKTAQPINYERSRSSFWSKDAAPPTHDDV